MNNKFIIRRMAKEEVQIAINWAGIEGWNPGLSDAECFYQADPQGFFLGLLNNEPIATGSAVIYDDHFAFCGLYIVKSEFRNQGYGIQLTEARLKYIGNRTTGLDGVMNKVSKYERLGYISAHINRRYVFDCRSSFSIASNVVDLKYVPFTELERFDRKYFPAARKEFLRHWIQQPNCQAIGYLQKQKLFGYGVVRKCLDGHKIGPLFAESLAIAQAVLEGLCQKISGGPIYIDMPEPNRNAELLAKHNKMNPNFEVIRMYRNGYPTIDLQGVYGITSYELG